MHRTWTTWFANPWKTSSLTLNSKEKNQWKIKVKLITSTSLISTRKARTWSTNWKKKASSDNQPLTTCMWRTSSIGRRTYKKLILLGSRASRINRKKLKTRASMIRATWWWPESSKLIFRILLLRFCWLDPKRTKMLIYPLISLHSLSLSLYWSRWGSRRQISKLKRLERLNCSTLSKTCGETSLNANGSSNKNKLWNQ